MKRIILTLLCTILILTGCSDSVVLTYPSYLFETEEVLDSTVESLKSSDGIKKVTVNDDGSVTLKMTPEHYEKIKEAALNTASSIAVYSVSEDTAIRNLVANEEFTQLDITVDVNHESLESEVHFVIYAMRLYHVCMMNDADIIFNYIDSETGAVYQTETYNVNGDTTVTLEDETTI